MSAVRLLFGGNAVFHWQVSITGSANVDAICLFLCGCEVFHLFRRLPTTVNKPVKGGRLGV